VTAAALTAALGFGVVGGLLAGLIGIGGGVILVPFLYLVLDHGAWSGVPMPPDRVTVVAHATSLAVIVPTAVSALRSFGGAGLVPWRAVVWMGAASAAAAAATTRVAPALPGDLLRAGFAAFLVVVGVRLFRRPSPGRARATGEGAGPVVVVAGGVLVGFFSALLGVGGGLVAIPLLIFAFRMDLRRVAAASMGVIAFAALAGTTGYLLARPDEALGPGTVGYVQVPLALALAPGAVVGAHWGARWNQRMDTDRLRRLFAVVLVLLGLRLAVPSVTGAVTRARAATSAAAMAWVRAVPPEHSGAPSAPRSSPAEGSVTRGSRGVGAVS
jgi:hypothetical protein